MSLGKQGETPPPTPAPPPTLPPPPPTLHVVRGDSERAPNFFGTAVFAYLLLADLITFLK
jgi:hypothetical protein